jgi:hypothetical protein
MEVEGTDGTLIFVEMALREPVSPEEGPMGIEEDAEEEEVDEWVEFGEVLNLSVFLRIDFVCLGAGLKGEGDGEGPPEPERVLVVVYMAGGPRAKVTVGLVEGC